MRILISACLLGLCCRYDGRGKLAEGIEALKEKHELIPFCPEIYGGLPTPREPAEIRGGRVITKAGADVTEEYGRGAREALKTAKALFCEAAVLQDRSPSCGIGQIHNGRFDSGLVSGDGITAALLKENGIAVIPASDIEGFLRRSEA
ncbi:MAG: DUF523 domain-containing protein [Eubacteriales bacterium]|nr:DUF523 domain-containing protein [Eubacteriales bacterium]MDD3881163.1 DUF523 domain-containing protein [Eubacteriales bacterium]MDD4511545.1 DUF523 domain-containing protein [Eubacteriales bacterium]